MKAPRGQNFLYQPQWLQRIAAAIGPSEALLEIGGGPGGLSTELAKITRHLWVVEVDPTLASALRLRFEVIEADILRLDLSQFGRFRVAGNLPYYITSPILLHLFRYAAHITDATILVQREVADRLTAHPGTRAFGLLSATAQFYARPERLFDIPPGAFRPAPKVYSTLVRLTMASQAATLGVEPEPFLRFLRRGFAQKRKQLASFLADPTLVGMHATARAEELTLPQWARLFQLTSTGSAGRGFRIP